MQVDTKPTTTFTTLELESPFDPSEAYAEAIGLAFANKKAEQMDGSFPGVRGAVTRVPGGEAHVADGVLYFKRAQPSPPPSESISITWFKIGPVPKKAEAQQIVLKPGVDIDVQATASAVVDKAPWYVVATYGGKELAVRGFSNDQHIQIRRSQFGEATVSFKARVLPLTTDGMPTLQVIGSPVVHRWEHE